VQPAAGQRLLRQIVATEVAAEDGGPLQQDLADVAFGKRPAVRVGDPDLVARERAAATDQRLGAEREILGVVDRGKPRAYPLDALAIALPAGARGSKGTRCLRDDHPIMSPF